MQSGSGDSSDINCEAGCFHTPGDQLKCSVRRAAGVWFGYISSVFYLSSRMSQIYKNFMRKCTEGLSVAMFLMAISANVSATVSPAGAFVCGTGV